MSASMRSCCIPGCGKTRADNAILHAFPDPVKEKDRFLTWVKAVGSSISSLEDQFIFKNRRICHYHFDGKYWTWSRKLSRGATPTLDMPGLEVLEDPVSRSNTPTDIEMDAPEQIKSEPITGQETPTDTLCINEPTALNVLDPNNLATFSEIKEETPEFGEKIHEYLTRIWDPLLKKGLTKDRRETLLKKYLIPENCSLLQAPKLNPEISAAIPETSRFHDRKITATQQQLGVGITAINRGLHLLVNNDSRVDAMQFISDGCIILSDLHYQHTESRINYIIPDLDKPLIQALEHSERDDTLFGNDLAEKIEVSKVIVKQELEINETETSIMPSSSNLR